MEGALDELVRSHGSRLLQFICRLLGSRSEAEDVWQETWFAIWRAGWRRRDGLDPWPLLRRAALTRVLDHRRRARSRPRLTTGVDPDPPLAPDPVAAPLDLRVLARNERAALVLYFWEGLSVAEIASELDATPNTVKTWMHRGRQRLRDALQDRRDV